MIETATLRQTAVATLVRVLVVAEQVAPRVRERVSIVGEQQA
jgi:hypothetical protein